MSNAITTTLILNAKSFQKSLTRVQQRLNGLQQTATTVGRTMQYAVGAALIAAGASAVKAAVDFDLVQAKLRALSGPENAQGVAKLGGLARELGKNSIYTAAQIAQMQLSLKRLGQSVTDIEGLTKPMLDFATAMDTDVAVAGETVIETLNKFSKSFSDLDTKAEKSTKVTEGFAYAVANSGLTFETFKNSLNFAGAEANAVGLSFADTAAILAKLADAGFKGSRGGTILRKALLSLGKTGGDVRKGFDGLVSSNAEFAEVLKIVGIRASGGIFALSGLGDEIKDFSKEIDNADGYVSRFGNEISGTFMAKMKGIASAVEELGISLLTKFERPIKDSLQTLKRFLNSITREDIAAFGQFLAVLIKYKVLATVASTLISLGTALGSIAGAVISALPFITALGAGIGGLAIALGGPVILAITALTAGLVSLFNKIDKARKEVERFEKANADAAKTAKEQNEAFEKLEELAPDEIYKRIRKGAIESMQAFQNGELAADAGLIAENFIPKSAFNAIIKRAGEMEAAAFGRNTFGQDNWMEYAINELFPNMKKAIEEVTAAGADLVNGLTLEETLRLHEWEKLEEALRAQILDEILNDPIKVEPELVFEEIELPEEVFEDDAFIEGLADKFATIRTMAEELTNVFISMGNVIGNAFADAARGTQTFAEAIKKNLIGAVTALIGKMAALAIAYGIAAVAKALFDGGSAMGQGARAITNSGFGSFLAGNMNLGTVGAGGMNMTPPSRRSFNNNRSTVAGTDLVITTGRGMRSNDRIYG